eukprot:6491083-Amphidinium_carterae.1
MTGSIVSSSSHTTIMEEEVDFDSDHSAATRLSTDAGVKEPSISESHSPELPPRPPEVVPRDTCSASVQRNASEPCARLSTTCGSGVKGIWIAPPPPRLPPHGHDGDVVAADSLAIAGRGVPACKRKLVKLCSHSKFGREEASVFKVQRRCSDSIAPWRCHHRDVQLVVGQSAIATSSSRPWSFGSEPCMAAPSPPPPGIPPPPWPIRSVSRTLELPTPPRSVKTTTGFRAIPAPPQKCGRITVASFAFHTTQVVWHLELVVLRTLLVESALCPLWRVVSHCRHAGLCWLLWPSGTGDAQGIVVHGCSEFTVPCIGVFAHVSALCDFLRLDRDSCGVSWGCVLVGDARIMDWQLVSGLDKFTRILSLFALKPRITVLKRYWGRAPFSFLLVNSCDSSFNVVRFAPMHGCLKRVT